MDEFIGEFIIETQEGLTALDTDLVTFSARPDDKALLDKIFRTLHTIKGTCGFLQLLRLEKVAHRAETLLDIFRKDARQPTPHDVDLILKAMDRIRFLVDAVGSGNQEPDGHDDELITAIQSAIDNAAPTNGSDTNGHDHPAPDAPPSAPPDIKDAGSPALAASPEQASQYLRIHVDTLEEMLTMVSELVLARNQLSQVVRDLNNAVLDTPLQRLDNVVSDLQDSVMRARMQPIGNAWAKFPRIIHDIARETGKSIRLTMTGEDTEVDRQVLEMIKDPLMHMVRNSADHGIEMPTDRIAAGKAETGTVSLDARHERGYIVIEIRDDGKGLSAEKIKKTAIARGIASEEDMARLPERQILAYIFEPGFSTAEKVTAISGRGVGMDVVRTNIEKIGGTIDLESEMGRGTCFTIRIPLTLAIISALLVKLHAQIYALPQLSVQEVIRVGADMTDKIETVGEFPVLRLREYLLPLVDLDGLLYEPSESFAKQGGYVVVIHAGAIHFGIIVDGIYGTEEIVVKPVPAALRCLSVFAGNTILGDGRVVLILDPTGIATQARLAGYDMAAHTVPDEQAEHEKEEHTSLLLFHAGNKTPKAVPAFLVSRIAEFESAQLERSGDQIVVQYQGRLTELYTLGDMPESDRIKALIFVDDIRNRYFGLIIDKVEDIVLSAVDIENSVRRAGYIGSAIIAGRATDIVDINHFTGDTGWIPSTIQKTKNGPRKRILLVDDSAFFRHMLQLLLNLSGYAVTVAGDPKEALDMCARGMEFDMIVSDIEMGDMDGLAFAEAVKSGSRWKDVPMVALTSRASPQDKQNGYDKGFTAYISKSDKEALLSTLRDVFENNHCKDVHA